MKLYITFGYGHYHQVNGEVFDKDCVASIECNDWVHGRKIAFQLFGPVFCTSYDDLELIEMKYFPRGIIEVEEPETEKMNNSEGETIQ